MDNLASAANHPSDLFGPKADLSAFWGAGESQTGEASALGLAEQKLSDKLALDIAIYESSNCCLLLHSITSE